MWSEQQPFEGPHAALEPIIRRYRESLVRDAATLGERDANLALDHQTPTPTPGESELFASYNTGLAEVEDALRNWREESMAYRSHAEQLLAAHGRGESLPRPPRRFRQRVWPWEWAGLVLVLAAEIWALVDPIAALFNLEEGSTKPVLFAFVVVLAAGGLAELHAWSRQRAEEAGTTAQRRRALIAAWLALLPVVAMGCIAVTARVYMVQLGEVGNVDGAAAIGEEAVPLMAFAAFQVVVSGAAIGLPRLFHRRL
ncbi:MAG: hypothetical protein N2037_14590, partial [Acidimicrobiales bacterium]|nr:hypothetical protein [Acidimicrobiales bacterium]